MPLHLDCSKCKKILPRREFSKTQWNKGKRGGDVSSCRCKNCISGQTVESSQEGWFDTFVTNYHDDEDATAAGNNNNNIDEENLLLSDLLSTEKRDNNTLDWNLIELSIHRNPEQVKTWSILVSYMMPTQSTGTEYPDFIPLELSLLEFVLTTTNPPFNTVKLILRVDPDRIVDSPRFKGWDGRPVGNVPKVLARPFRIAYYNRGVKDNILKYLLHATHSALQHNNNDPLYNHPLDILNFLLVDEPRTLSIPLSTKYNSMDMKSLQMILIEMSHIITENATNYPLYLSRSPIEFFLRYTTKKYFNLDMEKEGAYMANHVLFFTALISTDKIIIPSALSDEFFIHKIVSGWWPPCWKECVIIEQLIDSQSSLRNTRNMKNQFTNMYDGSLPLHIAIKNKWPWGIIQKIFELEPQVLQMRDTTTGLYPFQLAILDTATAYKVPEEKYEPLQPLEIRRQFRFRPNTFHEHIGKELLEEQTLRGITNCFHLLRRSPQHIVVSRLTDTKSSSSSSS